MAIVSCPECQKKLKVGDASVGKKVKCSCGHVFVAAPETAAAPVAAAVAPDKIVVACTECGAKLKVAETSMGKKMKCPKCAAVFVAAVEKAPRVESEPELFDEAVPKAKAKSELDDLFTFAQGEEPDEEAPVRGQGKRADAEFAETDDEAPARSKSKPARRPVPDDGEDEEDEPWQKRKAKKADPDEDDEPMPTGKVGKKSAKASPSKSDTAPIPVYSSRWLLNILVALMMLAFIAVFAAFFFGDDVGKLAGIKGGFHAELVGLPKPRITHPALKKLRDQDSDDNVKDSKKAALIKADIDRLQGIWIVESAENDGAAFEAAKGQTFVFEGHKVTSSLLGKAMLTIDASRDPKSIDLVSQIKGAPFRPGIYKFDADKLYLSLATVKRQKIDGKNKKPWEVGERPANFETKKATLFVLKRGAKKEPADAENKENGGEAKNKEIGKDTDGAASLEHPSTNGSTVSFSRLLRRQHSRLPTNHLPESNDVQRTAARKRALAHAKSDVANVELQHRRSSQSLG